MLVSWVWQLLNEEEVASLQPVGPVQPHGGSSLSPHSRYVALPRSKVHTRTKQLRPTRPPRSCARPLEAGDPSSAVPAAAVRARSPTPPLYNDSWTDRRFTRCTLADTPSCSQHRRACSNNGSHRLEHLAPTCSPSSSSFRLVVRLESCIHFLHLASTLSRTLHPSRVIRPSRTPTSHLVSPRLSRVGRTRVRLRAPRGAITAVRLLCGRGSNPALTGGRLALVVCPAFAPGPQWQRRARHPSRDSGRFVFCAARRGDYTARGRSRDRSVDATFEGQLCAHALARQPAALVRVRHAHAADAPPAAVPVASPVVRPALAIVLPRAARPRRGHHSPRGCGLGL